MPPLHHVNFELCKRHVRVAKAILPRDVFCASSCTFFVRVHTLSACINCSLDHGHPGEEGGGKQETYTMLKYCLD